MATDATGTPTSLGIRKYNTSVDAPSGLGFNGAMDDIDALLVARVTKPAGIVTNDVPVWNGTTWVKPTGSHTGTNFLRDDGSWASPGGTVVPTAFKVNGVFDYNTSTVEQSLISGAAATGTTGWQIPANQLGANGAIRVMILGDYLNSSGGTVNETIKVIFGGTTFYGDLQATFNAAGRAPFWVDFIISNTGATNTNFAAGKYSLDSGIAPSAGTVAGIKSLNTMGTSFASATQAIDTTAAKFLDVTALHGTSSASVSLRRMFAVAEYL